MCRAEEPAGSRGTRSLIPGRTPRASRTPVSAKVLRRFVRRAPEFAREELAVVGKKACRSGRLVHVERLDIRITGQSAATTGDDGHGRKNSRTGKTGRNSTNRRIRPNSADCSKRCYRTARSIAEVFVPLTLSHSTCSFAGTKRENGGPSRTRTCDLLVRSLVQVVYLVGSSWV